MRFLSLNYHFIGFLKKILLFLVLICFSDLQAQLWAIHSVLFLKFILGVSLRTHRTGVMNFLKSWNDLVLIGYFILVHLMDRTLRVLQHKSLEERERITDSELEEIANQQFGLGYVGIVF